MDHGSPKANGTSTGNVHGLLGSHHTALNTRECRGNINVSGTSRKLVAKILNMFKSFTRIDSTKYSRTGRKTVARMPYDSRRTFVRVSRKCGGFTMRFTISEHSYECRTTVARSLEKICKQLATIWQ